MILSVTFEKTDLQRAARTSSRRARRTSRARSGSARRSTTSTAVGLDAIAAHERRAARLRARSALARDPGRAARRHAAEQGAASLSFVLDDVHPHDVGTILDRQGVAIRTGHHCAQPVMERFGVPATVRASFAFYNTREDVDALVPRRSHAVREVFA